MLHKTNHRSRNGVLIMKTYPTESLSLEEMSINSVIFSPFFSTSSVHISILT